MVLTLHLRGVGRNACFVMQTVIQCVEVSDHFSVFLYLKAYHLSFSNAKRREAFVETV